MTIPASPVLRDTWASTLGLGTSSDSSDGRVTCELDSLGVALNGVGIFGGAVDTQCTGIDIDDTSSEWSTFDCCGGHAASGAYHYHFPPSCLIAQIGDLTDGHSPQVGWSYDGFPICECRCAALP